MPPVFDVLSQDEISKIGPRDAEVVVKIVDGERVATIKRPRGRPPGQTA